MAVTEIVATTSVQAQKRLVEEAALDEPHSSLGLKSVYISLDDVTQIDLPSAVKEVTLAASSSQNEGVSHVTRKFNVQEAKTKSEFFIPSRFLVHLQADPATRLTITMKDATTGAVLGSRTLEVTALSREEHDHELEMLDTHGSVIASINMRYRFSAEETTTPHGSATHYLPPDNSAGLTGLVDEVITGYGPEKFEGRRLNISIYKLSGVTTKVPTSGMALELRLGPQYTTRMTTGSDSIQDPVEGRVDTYDKGISFPYPAEGFRYVFVRLVEVAANKVIGEAQIDLKRVMCFRQNCQVGSVMLRAPPTDDSIVCAEVGELYYKLNRIIDGDMKGRIVEIACDPQTPTAISI